jgi:hypothetical protein
VVRIGALFAHFVPPPAGAVDERAADQPRGGGADAAQCAPDPQRLVPLGTSGKVVEMIDRAFGVIIAASAPWTTRAASSAAGDQASPHSSDAAVKNTAPE